MVLTLGRVEYVTVKSQAPPEQGIQLEILPHVHPEAVLNVIWVGDPAVETVQLVAHPPDAVE